MTMSMKMLYNDSVYLDAERCEETRNQKTLLVSIVCITMLF